MPTAAKLIAAITLAIAAYAASTVLLFRVEILQEKGINHFFFGLVGLVVGWRKLGPLAEKGYRGGWSGGVQAAIIVYVWCLFIAACHFVYQGFFKHAYKSIDEMLDGLFIKCIEYASYIAEWQVLVAAIFGGVLAGTFSAMAGRLWR